MTQKKSSVTSKAKRKELSRETILDAAMLLLETDSVEGISFRKLAAELDVTAMALYRHYADKSDLLTALLDEFICRADVLAADDLPWDQWLRQTSTNMYDALAEYPSWIPYLGQLGLFQSGMLVMERFIKVLSQSGFDAETSAKTFFAITHCIVGSACIQSAINSRLNAEDDKASSKQKQQVLNVDYQLLSEENFPSMLQHSNELAQVATGCHIDYGLDLIIAGLKCQQSK